MPAGTARRGPNATVRRLLATVAASTLALTGAACGTDSGQPASDEANAPTSLASPEAANPAVASAAALLPPADPNQPLPPNDVGTLRRLYDPALATMGLRLTRGALIDRSYDGYTPSDSGTHLALYVEPIDDAFTDADYADGLWNVSALITPDVFARWARIESYDICQEPLSSVDDAPEPLPQTQLNLTRAAAASIDWTNGSLANLLAAARSTTDLDLVVSSQVRDTSEYKTASKAAADLARDQKATATTSTGD